LEARWRTGERQAVSPIREAYSGRSFASEPAVRLCRR
jgi:hypothetical protein